MNIEDSESVIYGENQARSTVTESILIIGRGFINFNWYKSRSREGRESQREALGNDKTDKIGCRQDRLTVNATPPYYTLVQLHSMSFHKG